MLKQKVYPNPIGKCL